MGQKNKTQRVNPSGLVKRARNSAGHLSFQCVQEAFGEDEESRFPESLPPELHQNFRQIPKYSDVGGGRADEDYSLDSAGRT